MTDQPSPGFDSAEFRCGHCNTAIYAKTQAGLIRAVARHKLHCTGGNPR